MRTTYLASLLLVTATSSCVESTEPPTLEPPGDGDEMPGDMNEDMNDEDPQDGSDSPDCMSLWRQLNLSPGVTEHTSLGTGVLSLGITAADARADRTLLSRLLLDTGPVSFSLRFTNLMATSNTSGILAGVHGAGIAVFPLLASEGIIAYVPKTGDYTSYEMRGGEIRVELAGGPVGSESTWTITFVPESGQPPLTVSAPYTVEATMFPPLIQLFAVAEDSVEVDLDHAEIEIGGAKVVDAFDCVSISP